MSESPNITLKELRSRMPAGPRKMHTIHCNPSIVDDVLALPGFTPVAFYRTTTPVPDEIGHLEWFRFILDPNVASWEIQ